MTNDTMTDRVRKLFAKAESTTPEEAEALTEAGRLGEHDVWTVAKVEVEHPDIEAIIERRKRSGMPNPDPSWGDYGYLTEEDLAPFEHGGRSADERLNDWVNSLPAEDRLDLAEPWLDGVHRSSATKRHYPRRTAAQTASNATLQARAFAAAAAEYGFTWSAKGDMVTIQRSFAPGDRDAYVAADGDAYSVMALAPVLYSGTTWGTTSDGVGGHAGMTGGYYRLNKSGVSKRFINALNKMR